MEEAGHIAPTEALLFVITCILIGIATEYFLSPVIPIPYTAMLLVFGLAIGLIQGADPKTEAFTATLSLWMVRTWILMLWLAKGQTEQKSALIWPSGKVIGHQGIDPHLLLLIFLPTIGFSAALGQEPHLLRKNWGQILILAWPGVVVTFLLIAICAKFFFPYNWTWPQALLFGAMMSATDPVAVVAVLHEVGADEKLANVIDGESLVNDGSALVIFLVLQQFVQGASLTPAQIVVSFIHLALLGAAVGFAFSLITSAWLAHIFHNAALEIVLTFGAAYSCYYVAEELLGASGLLAVVVMGFSMSLMGGRHLTNRIKVEMHAFWSALEWIANTILFLWVGIALGLVLPPRPTHTLLQFEVDFSYHLNAVDVGYAVVLYLWLLVSRAVTIGVFYPILCTGRVGYPMTWRTAVVMVWAGLRGAVGVAMSLFILFDSLIDSDEYKAHCVFYMALMAFLTVLINGSTAKYVLKGLGLLKMTPQQIQVLEHVLQEVNAIRTTKLQQLHPDPVLGAADSAVVEAWTAVDAQATLAAAHRKLRRLHALTEKLQSSRGAAASQAAESAVAGHCWRELVAEYSRRLLHVVKAAYGEMYQHFELNTAEIGTLSEVTDEALDAATVAVERDAGHPDPENGGRLTGGLSKILTDWDGLRAMLEAPGWANRVDACLPKALLKTPLQQQAAAKLVLLSAFVDAHRTAEELIRAHLAQLSSQTSDAAAPPAEEPSKTMDNANEDSTARDHSLKGGSAPGKGAANFGAAVAHAAIAAPAGSADPAVDGEYEAAQVVLRASQVEVEAALQYAHEVVLPSHPQLASLLMSRHVAVQVLEEQQQFLESIEAAGLIKGEEVNEVQHQLNLKLEQLQCQRHWHLPPREAPETPWVGQLLSSTERCESVAAPDRMDRTPTAAAEAAQSVIITQRTSPDYLSSFRQLSLARRSGAVHAAYSARY